MLQDKTKKCKDVNCAEKNTWSGTRISSRRRSSRTGFVRLPRDCTVTWIQQETVKMPQLQEVPEPLEEAVSIPVAALMSAARWEM